MTTNQGNDMASFNDEHRWRDEALTDREDEEGGSQFDRPPQHGELCESRAIGVKTGLAWLAT
jgi:hypothetical protein